MVTALDPLHTQRGGWTGTARPKALLRRARIWLSLPPGTGNELKAYIKRQIVEQLKSGGLIEASTENNCLYGKLLFIRPLVSYEGQTVAELQTAFHAAVDDYLESCQKLGRKPETSCKGSLMEQHA